MVKYAVNVTIENHRLIGSREFHNYGYGLK